MVLLAPRAPVVHNLSHRGEGCPVLVFFCLVNFMFYFER